MPAGKAGSASRSTIGISCVAQYGYPAFTWEDRAILRSFRWLQDQAAYQATGDDEWQMHVVNFFYRANMPAALPARPGKNMGWTDWTHRR